MTDTLPAEQLVQRNDSDWERECSQERIDAAKAFALPLMTRIMAMQKAWDLDVDGDAEFSELVDQLWDGVRRRLTRQDLLMAFFAPMNPLADKQAQRIVAQVKRDVEKLTET